MCRRLVRMKCYNSRALKCMLLFDVCLNYSTRWIISWNRCACAVHKMLGISHKILVDLALSLSRPGCECVVRVCLVLSSFNENLKTVMLYSCTHNHTNTHITQRHAAWVGFRQSVLRYFFFTSKVNFRYVYLGDCLLKITLATKKGATLCMYAWRLRRKNRFREPNWDDPTELNISCFLCFVNSSR